MKYHIYLSYKQTFQKILNLLNEISLDREHIVYKRNIKIYMGMYIYNVTINSSYIMDAVSEYYGKYDTRTITFVKDEQLGLDEYAFTKKCELINTINDVYNHEN